MKQSKVLLSISMVLIIAVTLIAGNFWFSPVSIAAKDGNPYKIKTFPGPDGKLIDEVVFPVKPPVEKIKASIVLPPTGGGVNYVADQVPALDWSYGCSATSAAMLFGYYDRTGYSNFYTGPTNGGVFPMPTDSNNYWGFTTYASTTCYECPLSASHQGVDGRTTRGHVDDYWIDYGNKTSDPYIVGGWQEHTSDSVGDYMGTNQSKYGNSDGSTTFYFYGDGAPYSGTGGSSRDGGYGMKLFAQSKGYTVSAEFNQYIYGYNGNTKGFTFANYMAEIDAGRPVLIQVAGHSMIGFGYNTTGNLVYLHNTWNFGDDYMVWGGTYSGMQHYAVTVLRLTPVNTSPSVTINQASGQSDPTNNPVINFTVVFSEAVTEFVTGDVTIAGTTPGDKTAAVTGSGATYNVAISGMSGPGTVIASIAAGVARDAEGNTNTASTSTDNSVTYDNILPSKPTITSISPSQARRGRTLNVTITGTNLTGATAVNFGEGTSTSVVANTSTQITARVTISKTTTIGFRDVSVTTPTGTATLTSGFKILK